MAKLSSNSQPGSAITVASKKHVGLLVFINSVPTPKRRIEGMKVTLEQFKHGFGWT